METEEIRELVPGASGDASAAGLLRVKEQRHRWLPHQCIVRNTAPGDCVTPIHEMVHELESPGVLSKSGPACSSPVWPVHKSKGEWRLTVEYHGLNEVTSPSAAMLGVLNLQCELESVAAQWYHHRQNSCVFLHSFIRTVLAQLAFTCRGIQCNPGLQTQPPTIYHGIGKG